MAKVNYAKDAFFLQRIRMGEYRVSRKTGRIYNRRGKVLGTVNSRGYITIGAKDDNRKLFIVQAHRVVWMYFKGPIPYGMILNHKDGDKQNNRLSNLELVTDEENNRHAYETELNIPYMRDGIEYVVRNSRTYPLPANVIPFELPRYVPLGLAA